jgi:predicted permease
VSRRQRADGEPCRAPRLPALLITWTLPHHERGALVGDLDEEYEARIRPLRGKLRADAWYWNQALRSIIPNLRRRRHRAAIPDHPHPAHPGRSQAPRGLSMDKLHLDLRLALRTLRARPGFTAVAVITLALGIGANSAIFSVINAVLLRPLPYPQPAQLMTVWLDNRLQGWPQDITSYPMYEDWRDRSSSFADMAAWSFGRMNVSGDGEPQRVLGVQASPNLMQVLGAKAAEGRVFSPTDWEGDPNVMVLSHGYWQSRFGGDSAAIGRTLTLNGEDFTIVGVMPADFAFGSEEARFWRPFPPAVVDTSRRSLWLQVIGRLADGVTVDAARADMDRVGAQLEEEFPLINEGYGVTIVPLHQEIVGDVSRALWILLGAVGFVVLIACANVANMSLARAAAREGEMALRAALGADRRRLLRQMLTESILLAGLGGVLGLLVAFWCVRLLRFLGPDLPRLDGVGIDAGVLGFTALVALATGVLFGVVPALRVSRPDLNEALKEGGRGASRGTGVLRHGLVAAEIALALVLLVGAGLLLRSYSELRHVDLGMQPDGLLMTSVALPDSSYPESADVYRFFTGLLENVAAIPGVESVAAIDAVPLGTRFSSGFFTIRGRPPVSRDELMEVKFNVVTPGYFATVQTPLLSGRAFEAADAIDDRRVVVINDTMRRMYFPGEDPVGQQFLFGRPQGYVTEEDPDPELPWFDIVGVVADVPQRSVRQPVEPEVFMPYAEGRGDALTLLVRTAGDPTAVAGAVRAAVWNLDADLPVANQEPLRDLVDESSAPERLNARLLGLFALLALTLAAVGIYGVMSYTVSQRNREIGIRIALGASTLDVARTVLRGSLTVTAVGLAIGFAVAVLTGRLMSSLLFGVAPTDPLTFVAVAALLCAIAVAASLIPARRAARLDPTMTLHE